MKEASPSRRVSLQGAACYRLSCIFVAAFVPGQVCCCCRCKSPLRQRVSRIGSSAVDLSPVIAFDPAPGARNYPTRPRCIKRQAHRHTSVCASTSAVDPLAAPGGEAKAPSVHVHLRLCPSARSSSPHCGDRARPPRAARDAARAYEWCRDWRFFKTFCVHAIVAASAAVCEQSKQGQGIATLRIFLAMTVAGADSTLCAQVLSWEKCV